MGRSAVAFFYHRSLSIFRRGPVALALSLSIPIFRISLRLGVSASKGVRGEGEGLAPEPARG